MSDSQARLEVYCYMVQRGKPAALMPIQKRHLEAAEKTVTDIFGLKFHVEELHPGWVSLWIYKYPHILEVIKAAPQDPRSVTDHWLLGKLFGYEEAAIQKLLESI